jgi:hypothetical protein
MSNGTTSRCSFSNAIHQIWIKIVIKVFESGVFRRIFGPKRDEVTGGWRKLHNEELHNLYASPKVKHDEMGRECSPNGR